VVLDEVDQRCFGELSPGLDSGGETVASLRVTQLGDRVGQVFGAARLEGEGGRCARGVEGAVELDEEPEHATKRELEVGPVPTTVPGVDDVSGACQGSANISVVGFQPPHHFAKAKCRTEVQVQVHAIGPFQLTFVNPEDDPRR
jgi:hypothetical protein